MVGSWCQHISSGLLSSYQSGNHDGYRDSCDIRCRYCTGTSKPYHCGLLSNCAQLDDSTDPKDSYDFRKTQHRRGVSDEFIPQDYYFSLDQYGDFNESHHANHRDLDLERHLRFAHHQLYLVVRALAYTTIGKPSIKLFPMYRSYLC